MTLEDALHEAAAKGLTHLSLVPRDKGWEATATPSTGHHYVTKLHADPVKAVLAVLDEMPKARKRAGKALEIGSEPKVETEDEKSSSLVVPAKTQKRKRRVTAAVTPPEPDADILATPAKTRTETAEDWLPEEGPRSKR